MDAMNAQRLSLNTLTENVIDQAPGVQRVDNFIQWISRYPTNKMC